MYTVCNGVAVGHLFYEYYDDDDADDDDDDIAAATALHPISCLLIQCRLMLQAPSLRVLRDETRTILTETIVW
jgi:hypothetical protein